jgi:GNAT superfamily N-acetyltransferase
MNIQEIEAEQTLALRSEVLRPGRAAEECVFPGDTDKSTCHLGAFIDRELVGIASLYLKSNASMPEGRAYQLRSMATKISYQGKGIGFALLEAVEKQALVLGADYLWANARKSALGFYRKADYQIDDQEFYIEGVGPHHLILKPSANFGAFLQLP